MLGKNCVSIFIYSVKFDINESNMDLFTKKYENDIEIYS